MLRTLRKKMKPILIIIIVFFGISIFYGLGQYRSSQERKLYIAEVNGVGITYNQWQNTFLNAISRYDDKTLSSMDQSLINSFKKNILEQIINYELLFQQAEKEKVKISQSNINLEIDKIKDNFSTPEEFNEVLKANKITLTQLKDDIKRQLMIKYILEEAVSKINITDDNLIEYYNKNQESFFEPEKVHARHILVETEEEAKNIIYQLKEGIIDFAELAKEKSICPSAEKGGDLGFFARGQMVKEFEDAAFSLKPGEISEIVKTEFGYHIIKCEEKKEEHSPSFEEVKDQINNTLSYQRENEETLALISKLKAEANIVINYDFESENISNQSSPEDNQTSSPPEEITSEETTETDEVKDTLKEN